MLSGFLAVFLCSSTVSAIRPTPPSNPQDTEDGRALRQHFRSKEQQSASPALQQPVSPQMLGLLVIPGLGRVDRLDTVIHNLRMLAAGGHLVKQGGNTADQKKRTWDCVIYIYADRKDPSNSAFFAETDKLSFLSSYCQLKEHPNQVPHAVMHHNFNCFLASVYDNIAKLAVHLPSSNTPPHPVLFLTPMPSHTPLSFLSLTRDCAVCDEEHVDGAASARGGQVSVRVPTAGRHQTAAGKTEQRRW